MARRRAKRRTTRRTFGRMVRRSRRNTGLKHIDVLLGGGIAAVTEPIADQFINKITGGNTILDDFAKVGIGAWAYKKQKGVLKGIALSYMVLGTANIVRQYSGNLLGGILGGGSTSTSNGYNTYG